VCAAAHPLWGADRLPVTELPRLRCVLREAKAAMRIVLDETLRDIGIPEIPVATEVGSTDTIVERHERGRHVSFLPRLAVDEDLRERRLHQIKI